MTVEPVLYLREQDVVDLVTLPDALASLEQVLAREHRREATNAPKSLIVAPGSVGLHSLSSGLLDGSYLGTKTWINSPNGAVASYLLFDGTAGRLLAIMEANALGSLRTAGIAGLATRWLAPPGQAEALIVGAGRQATLQAAALIAATGLTRLRVFNRTRARQVAFAQSLERSLGIETSCPDTLADALKGAGIVTLVTRAEEPFVTPDLLDRPVHVNAMGAVLPSHAELDRTTVGKAELVVVDNLVNAQATSRELREVFGDGRPWSEVRTLGSLIAEGRKRDDGAGMTLFKSVGMGLSDLAIAIPAFERAREEKRGTAIPYPQPAVLPWNASAGSRRGPDGSVGTASQADGAAP